MTEPLRINIPLHTSQLEVLKDKHRFKVINCGRQWGKSHLAAAFSIMMSMSHPNSVGWVISPTYRQSGFLFDKVVTLCKEYNVPIKVKKSNQEMTITFTLNGSQFHALSGDDPDKLRGQTLAYLIIDEAAMLKDELWTKHLRPMTAVHSSPVMFISTPKGKNYFYDLFKMGQDKDNKQWYSCTYTSYDGIICANDKGRSHPGKDELDAIKAETDDLTWRQEYLAEFLDSGGVVFNEYHCMLDDMSKECEEGVLYYMSIDLAKHKDYTVVFVAEAETGRIVDYYRVTGLSWESQIARIKEMSDYYSHPRIFVDSTGLGDTIVERMIVQEGLDVHGIVFTSKSKQQMVQNLAVMLQHGELLVPDVREIKDELDRYTFTHTSTGQFKYGAPDGYHDDIVSSLMLLAWGLSKIPIDIGFMYEDDSKTEITSDNFDWESTSDKLSWDDSEYRLDLI